MSTTIHHNPLEVRPTGELDLAAGDALESLVTPMLAPGIPLSIDLSAVSFVDSSGLGALVAIEQKAREQGTVLTLTHLSLAVRRLLHVAGLTDFFSIDER